jgi:hypothetical protein
VVRRVVRADVSPDRAAIPHLNVGDLGGNLGEDRPRDVHLRGGHDLGVGRHRAEVQRVAADGDRAQLIEQVQVDQHVRRRRPGLHHVHQRLAACERARPLVRCEKPDRLVHGGRPRVLDLTQEHDGIKHSFPGDMSRK